MVFLSYSFFFFFSPSFLFSFSFFFFFLIGIVLGPVIFQGSLTQGLSNTSVCDLDFFVQKDSIPSFGSWIDRDISTYKISTLHVDGACMLPPSLHNLFVSLKFSSFSLSLFPFNLFPSFSLFLTFILSAGTYYFGIYGYRGCNYTFVYRVIGSCDCEPDHGECEAGSSQCSCYTGYMGDKCATTYVPMESGMQDAKANALGWYDRERERENVRGREQKGSIFLFPLLSLSSLSSPLSPHTYAKVLLRAGHCGPTKEYLIRSDVGRRRIGGTQCGLVCRGRISAQCF